MDVPDSDSVHREFRELLERNRTRCLWFLSPDYCPNDLPGMLTVLRYLQRFGDRETFVHARRIERWLLPKANAASAG
jgi:hypothetical protein